MEAIINSHVVPVCGGKLKYSPQVERKTFGKMYPYVCEVCGHVGYSTGKSQKACHYALREWWRCPTQRALSLDDCPRCGGSGAVHNDGFVLVACPVCTGNRQ